MESLIHDVRIFSGILSNVIGLKLAGIIIIVIIIIIITTTIIIIIIMKIFRPLP